MRWTLALATGSAALLFVAACGSDDNSDAGTGNGSAGGFNAYADCLREQGITLPTNQPRANGSGRPTAFPSDRPTAFPSGRPSGGPSGEPSGGPGGGMGGPGGGFRPEGVDDATWQKAQEACQSVRPTGGPGGGGPGGNNGGGNRQADAAYRNCISDRGVDPQATTDPKYAAAAQACAVLSPSPSPSS
ncbi:hypothetical protein [Phytohabitans rumicis]|nr:hypothetical protein [Phytohabitans rumicis]